MVGRKRLEKVLSQGMAVIGGGRAGPPEPPPEAEAAVRSARLARSPDGRGDEGEAGGRVLMTGFISALTVGKGEDLRPFSKLSDWEKG